MTRFFSVGSFQKGKEEKRENENIKNWEPFMLNLFFMLGLPEIFPLPPERAVVIPPIPSPFGPKLLFLSWTFFEKKRIEFFYYLNVLLPPICSSPSIA